MSLYEAFEGCLLEMRSITLVDQKFNISTDLERSLVWLFRDARQLEFVELRNCEFGSATEGESFQAGLPIQFLTHTDGMHLDRTHSVLTETLGAVIRLRRRIRP